MIVPDEAIFSNNPWGSGNLTYKDARDINDEKEMIKALKARLDIFLINQIIPLTKYEKNNKCKIWSPFPLTILTLLGIETLGRIIGNKSSIEKETFETSKKYSKPIYQLIDSSLLYKPTKSFYTDLEIRLGKNDKKSIDSYCDVIHKYMRNTYTHGFQGLLVYLDHKLTEGWAIKEGYIILNPYWFWDKFFEIYENTFVRLIDKQNKGEFENAIFYFKNLIK